MELGNFTPPERGGDRLPAKEAVDRPLVVLVREHRTGIVTQYRPDGANGVVCDVADTNTNSVWLDVLWMNGAVVDNLAPYVGQAVPIKLTWTPSARGGNAFIGVQALDGAELATAQQWASANPNRFDSERHQRGTGTSGEQQQPAATAPAAAPAAAPAENTTTGPTGAADPNDPAVQALLQQINAGQQPPAAS